ncbi:hypothetical protein Tco_0544319, partial [Tanacetum coccineum]
ARGLIPTDQRPKPHVTPPLVVGELILEKSPSQNSIEKPDSKIVAAREKKDKQNLAKAQEKRTGEGVPATPRKKGVRRNQVPASSGSKRTISITPLHYAAPNPAD